MESRKITLIGYRFSVYTRIVKLVLIEKGLDFTYSEADPFDHSASESLLTLHPFRRVPILIHDGCKFYETAAILRYLDLEFPDLPLTPAAHVAVGRMQQVIGIIDSYGYNALIRNVFSNAVFLPLEGERGDTDAVQTGLRESIPVLHALDEIADEGTILNGLSCSLADFYLVPMIAYFRMVQAGAQLMDGHFALMRWWEKMETRRSTVMTRPDMGEVVPSNILP
ncbi:MAG: glutathione S-transferase family protein [Pseudotabrizicola sp.]|uniref:glutathione S-transferase family protein n=1 Tax=Pseudotabrizicola sp. TaxID=2939647 RepID=UPI00271566A6|nr:glutathione S-transferase family protein [Pseudotabrizicola sp.]MDO9637828.1 glutathione S-transferase family protein [Pseudotabrizicola sp.]